MLNTGNLFRNNDHHPELNGRREPDSDNIVRFSKFAGVMAVGGLVTGFLMSSETNEDTIIEGDAAVGRVDVVVPQLCAIQYEARIEGTSAKREVKLKLPLGKVVGMQDWYRTTVNGTIDSTVCNREFELVADSSRESTHFIVEFPENEDGDPLFNVKSSLDPTDGRINFIDESGKSASFKQFSEDFYNSTLGLTGIPKTYYEMNRKEQARQLAQIAAERQAASCLDDLWTDNDKLRSEYEKVVGEYIYDIVKVADSSIERNDISVDMPKELTENEIGKPYEDFDSQLKSKSTKDVTELVYSKTECEVTDASLYVEDILQ